MSSKEPSPPPMPEWPTEPAWNPMNPQRSQAEATNYERAMKEAYAARLRYLIHVIRRYGTHADLHEAVARVGEVPE